MHGVSRHCNDVFHLCSNMIASRLLRFLSATLSLLLLVNTTVCSEADRAVVKHIKP
jgi:hypothetical protein